MGGGSVIEYIDSGDPLSDEVFEYLLNYHEEDEYVDYKQSFEPEPKNSKDWLSLVEDMMAFANTFGGYLVFGVEDATYAPVGLKDDAVSALSDINKVNQRVNAYIVPEITKAKSKCYTKNNNKYVVIYVPQSKGSTHIISKEGKFKYPSGEEKIKFHLGQIYVRRSASIAVLSSQDLDLIIERRIDYYKERVLSRISRVIEAPLEQHVLIVDPEKSTDEEGVMKFVVSDSPDAMPVKGISFTVAPETEVQVINSAIALKKYDAQFSLSQRVLWNLYSKRDSITLEMEQAKSFSLMCLLEDVPTFYWIAGLPKAEIEKILIEVVRSNRSIQIKATALYIAILLGRAAYSRVRNASGDAKDRLGDPIKTLGDPKELFHVKIINSKVEKVKGSKEKLSKALTELAIQCSRQCGVLEKAECWALDCYLYSKDRYTN